MTGYLGEEGTCVKCGGKVDRIKYGVDGDGGLICSECFPAHKSGSFNNWGSPF